MATMFHEGSRSLQDRFDTRRIANRIEEVLAHDFISEDAPPAKDPAREG